MFYSKGSSLIAVFDDIENFFINFKNNIRLENVSYKKPYQNKNLFLKPMNGIVQ